MRFICFIKACVRVAPIPLSLSLFTPWIASAAAPTSQNLMQPIGSMSKNVDLATYLQRIFQLTIGIAGVLAVVMIVWCGIKMIGSPSVSEKQAAKECITNAIFGVLLALGSWIILNTISTSATSSSLTLGNPTPTPIVAPPTTPPGTYVSVPGGSTPAVPPKPGFIGSIVPPSYCTPPSTPPSTICVSYTPTPLPPPPPPGPIVPIPPPGGPVTPPFPPMLPGGPGGPPPKGNPPPGSCTPSSPPSGPITVPNSCFGRSVVYRDWTTAARGDGTFGNDPREPEILWFGDRPGRAHIMRFKPDDAIYNGDISATFDMGADSFGFLSTLPCDFSTVVRGTETFGGKTSTVIAAAHGNAGTDFRFTVAPQSVYDQIVAAKAAQPAFPRPGNPINVSPIRLDPNRYYYYTQLDDASAYDTFGPSADFNNPPINMNPPSSCDALAHPGYGGVDGLCSYLRFDDLIGWHYYYYLDGTPITSHAIPGFTGVASTAPSPSPSPTPPGGSCVAPTNVPFSGSCPGFDATTLRDVTPGDFTGNYIRWRNNAPGANDALVVRIKTPNQITDMHAANTLSRLSGIYETANQPLREFALSASPCDFTGGLANGSGSGISQMELFTVGASGGFYPALAPNSTYYFNVKLKDTSFDCSSSSCAMAMDFYPPGLGGAWLPAPVCANPSPSCAAPPVICPTVSPAGILYNNALPIAPMNSWTAAQLYSYWKSLPIDSFVTNLNIGLDDCPRANMYSLHNRFTYGIAFQNLILNNDMGGSWLTFNQWINGNLAGSSCNGTTFDDKTGVAYNFDFGTNVPVAVWPASGIPRTVACAVGATPPPASPPPSPPLPPPPPWTILGVHYTTLAQVQAAFPDSCVVINGVQMLSGFGPCAVGTAP